MTWNVEWKPQNTLSALMGDLKHRPAAGFKSSRWALWDRRCHYVKLHDWRMSQGENLVELWNYCLCKYQSNVLLSHCDPPAQRQHCSPLTGFLFVTFSLIVHLSPGLPSASTPFSIFRHFQPTNQSPAQFTSDSNLASIAVLIPAASCSGGRMQRKKRRQSQRDAAVPLVSLNLSEVLCQVFPVHSCIPFSSLKVAQKEWGL